MNMNTKITGGKIATINQRQAGFTLLELMVTLAIVAILAGMAVFGIRDVLPAMRADGAMYRVQESLRESRMLAMSDKHSVRLEFSTAGDGINAMIMADEDLDAEEEASWADILVMVERASDPSISLNGDGRFIKWSEPSRSALDTSRVAYAPDPVANIASAGERFVFKPDGMLTHIKDIYSPINGTIFIGPPEGVSDPTNRLARAVTILGATGRINGWRWKNGGWTPTK